MSCAARDRNAILLPHGLEFNIQSIPALLPSCPECWVAPSNSWRKRTGHGHGLLVKNLLGRLNRISGLPVRLRDAGVAEDKLPAIASAAINDGALAFNPVEVSYDEALRC